MQRRKFIENSCMIVVGMGAFGSIHWKDDCFVGDSPTTTDILGPFYRPAAPFRNNLNPSGFKGGILHFSGTLFKADGTTPLKDGLIEIWQCQQDGYYDNTSDEHLYRASQKLGADGKYYFITAIPVPYANEENGNQFRPAHIHMRISAEKQQDLITQIYFKGDPYLAADPSTKSALAINRILTVEKMSSNESKVRFDIVLRDEYVPDDTVFHKISGIYKMSDGSMMEFYRDGDLLFWKRNNQIRGGLSYHRPNTFVGGVDDIEAKFELQPLGNAKLLFRFSRRKEVVFEGIKVLSYVRE